MKHWLRRQANKLSLVAENRILRETVERQTKILDEKYGEAKLVQYVDGELTIQGGPIPVIAEYLLQILKKDDGGYANFAEMGITHKEAGKLTLTLQRASGKSPFDLMKAAEKERDDALARLRIYEKA